MWRVLGQRITKVSHCIIKIGDGTEHKTRYKRCKSNAEMGSFMSNGDDRLNKWMELSHISQHPHEIAASESE